MSGDTGPLREKLLRGLAEARERLEGTRREHYGSTTAYAAAVTQRLHAVRRLKLRLAESEALGGPTEGA